MLLDGWDGELTPPDRKQIDRHVDQCDICADRVEVEMLQAMEQGMAPLFGPPLELRDEVLQAVHEFQPRSAVLPAGRKPAVGAVPGKRLPRADQAAPAAGARAVRHDGGGGRRRDRDHGDRDRRGHRAHRLASEAAGRGRSVGAAEPVVRSPRTGGTVPASSDPASGLPTGAQPTTSVVTASAAPPAPVPSSTKPAKAKPSPSQPATSAAPLPSRPRFTYTPTPTATPTVSAPSTGTTPLG